MSCCLDLHYLLYYGYDLHCDMSRDWSGEASRFVPPLSLSQLCQPDQFIENLLSNSECGISKTKEKFLTTTVIIFFINNKTLCNYLNPLMPGSSKRSNIIKQTYSQKLLFILTLSWRKPLSYRNQAIDLLCKSMDWLLYDNGHRHERVKYVWPFASTRHERVKRRNCQGKKLLQISNFGLVQRNFIIRN